MNPITAESTEHLETDARTLRDRARSTASVLARHGHRRQRMFQLLRSINVIAGVALAAITFVPPLRQLVGDTGVDIGVAVAAAILIGDVVIPLMIGGPSPDLFLIFAFYTDSYATQIDQILMEDPVTERDRHYRRGRLQELLRHARLNFDDLKVRFPPSVLSERSE